MARAQKRKWIDLVAGLLVGMAAQPLTLLAGPDAGFASQAAPDAPADAARRRIDALRMALNAAIEAERFGDLDKAAVLYREAQARAADLPPDERRELDRRFAANVLAVLARRDAHEHLALAESALQGSRAAEAAALVKKITVNELYLSAADKPRFQALCQRLHFQPGTATANAGNAVALAHAKIQQGRAELAKSDLDAAETLAREADQLHVTFTPQEDSPRRLIEDLEKARKDAKTLLLAPRAALKRNALDRAEQFARSAEQQASPFTFMLSDSPAKVLKEIQSARQQSPENGAVAAKEMATPSLPASAAPAMQSANTDKARALVHEGRQAFARGDVVVARKCAEQASTLHGNLPWFEDNPASLLEDITRAAPNAATTAAAPVKAGNSIKTKDEAIALLKQGREELTKGELEKANATAARLRAAQNIHWGMLFDDTPDKFQADVDHARLKHNKEQSVELLAEARRRLEKRDYDGAKKLAYEAQTKHGNYSILDFGDRPCKLIAEVDAAQQKEHRIKLPDPPTTPREMADLRQGPLAQPGANNNTLTANNPRGTTNPANPVTPASYNASSADLDKARQIMKDARVALNAGALMPARLLADRVRDMHVMLPPTEDSPESLYRDLERLSKARQNNPMPSMPVVNKPTPPTPMPVVNNLTPMPVVNNPTPPASRPNGGNRIAETRARQLVVEARLLLRQNRLPEAREKIVEAQRLGVSFRPDEESPGQLSQQIAFQARQRIDGLVRHAGETIRYGTQSPQLRCQEAEHDLTQARQLAVAFGQDLQPIEITLRMVNQLRTTGSAILVSKPAKTDNALPPSSIDKNAPAQRNQSAGTGPLAVDPMQLLDKARLELKSGETANARHLAEEAIQHGAGPAGLAVLRNIDIEDNAQARRRTNTAFDAVMRAYYRRDYRQASFMLANLDTKQLDERRQARLREMLNTPEMQPSTRGSAIALTGGQQPSDRDSGSRLTPQPQPQLHTPDAGHAHVSDDPGQSLLARTRALREVKFQQLRSECLTVQGQALERFRTGQTDNAVDMLQEYLARLANEQLDPGQLTLLRRPIESRLQQFNLLKAQAEMSNNRFDERSRRVQKDLLQAKTSEQVKQQNVASSMKQYNELFKIGKYAEAEMVAMRVHDLDPDNPMATAAMTIARLHRHDDDYNNTKHDKEEYFLQALGDNDKMAPPDAVTNNIAYPKDQERLDTIRKRKSLDSLPMPRKSTEERNIERKLLMPVTLSFVNTSLRQIVQDIRGEQGINIFVDEPALAEKGIGLDSPLTIQLDNIALKSGLKLLLNLVHLTYVVADDVLKITTEEQARGKLQQKVYQVTDLVIAVENVNPESLTPSKQLGLEVINQTPNGASSQSQATGMPGGQQVGFPAGGSMAGTNSNFASSPGSGGNGGGSTVVKNQSQTHEDMLIKIITSTIEPRSWADQGGPGTIDYHPLTMALVINQTPDIQDQVQDLLNALRRLIDQEVAVEVKFISIAEDFFERIGVNFNMNIVNNSRQALQYQPQLTSGQFAQPGYINTFAPSNFLSGLTPAGTLTNDLNIPITTNTYSQAIPPFGGYPGVPGFGGLTLGLAFLSDIQVFLFMEAVQGDVRSNVMQAPKLTLFNGQTATISVTDFQFFTIGVNVTNGGFGQLIYNPVTTLFPLRTQLFIQAVISGDRRFVRLSLQPSLSNIVNGEVNLFPVVTPIFPLFDGTATGQPVVFTQFVQQPRATSVFVQTTVAVPDGGTVLMGGLKRLSEGRNEYGPPIISKIPYLSRLFRNVGYGRSAESLLIMVTPRIIIQAEEEEKQTGYTPPPAVGAP